MAVTVTEDELFPGEEVLLSKLANLWIKPSQHGLVKAKYNLLLGDNESLGGRAFLTNYRILFKSHGLNRLVGIHSMFLPNIVEIHKGWFGITVESRAQTFKFVMWFNANFVRTAQQRKEEIGRKELERLRKVVRAHPDRLGTLEKHATLNAVNDVLSGALAILDALSELEPADRSAAAELVALFSDEE